MVAKKTKKTFNLNEIMPELKVIYFGSNKNRATFKVQEKSVIGFGQSPGVYRRISATKDLLKEDTQLIRLRNSEKTEKALNRTNGRRDSDRVRGSRRSCAQVLAAKMAEVGHCPTAGWPNSQDD
jgi:hypothetical protein